MEAAGLVDQHLQGRGLDVLINNAGVMPLSRQGLEGMYVMTARRFVSNLTNTVGTT